MLLCLNQILQYSSYLTYFAPTFFYHLPNSIKEISDYQVIFEDMYSVIVL